MIEDDCGATAQENIKEMKSEEIISKNVLPKTT